MGVNIFVPITAVCHVDDVVKAANEKAKGRFDWCDKFAGPEGWLLNLEDALAFTEEEAPWWVMTERGMVKVKVVQRSTSWPWVSRAAHPSRVPLAMSPSSRVTAGT